MDFMKVFDQTVREIKREVNLKVLKVPEIEQKVLDATDDEPWGPHGTVLAEIAQATKKFTECQMVMNVLWTRLTETGKNWRFVYKSLTVIEYLVGHGSERAVDDIIEHTFKISSLASFEYVEQPSGKDCGINVRKKAETIVALLNNKEKMQEVRNKAAVNRDKYVGLSSSGITYKSGAASFSSSSNNNSDRYGGFGNKRDSESFNESYKEEEYGEDKYGKTTKSKNESSRYGSVDQDSPATGASKTSKPDQYASVASQNKASNTYDEDFDDFDPRGSSSTKPSSGSQQVDLFGQDLIGDLLDDPVSAPTDKSTSLDNDPSSEVDLFADADFVSATPLPAAEKIPEPQVNVDLFASHPAPALAPAPAPAPAVSTTIDFFAAPNPPSQIDCNASKSDQTSNIVDPFANVPLHNFDVSDPFGAFSSPTDSISTVSNQSSSNQGSNGNMKGASIETKAAQPKDPFQVKSGIWADSLSRGLIDLNIAAPKKVNLADVGIVGGLTDPSDEKDKGPLPSFYMGRPMGSGPMIGKSGFTPSTSTDDNFFSSLSSQQNQFGSFQK